jgi:hypothetical protein
VGCTTTSYETLQSMDELAIGDILVAAGEEGLPELERVLGAHMPEAEARAAARSIAAAFASKGMAHHHRQHAEAGELIAKRLGLGSRARADRVHRPRLRSRVLLGVLEHPLQRDVEDARHAEGHLERRGVAALLDGDDALSRHADPVGELGLRHLAGGEA